MAFCFSQSVCTKRLQYFYSAPKVLNRCTIDATYIGYYLTGKNIKAFMDYL